MHANMHARVQTYVQVWLMMQTIVVGMPLNANRSRGIRQGFMQRASRWKRLLTSCCIHKRQYIKWVRFIMFKQLAYYITLHDMRKYPYMICGWVRLSLCRKSASGPELRQAAHERVLPHLPSPREALGRALRSAPSWKHFECT